MVVNGNNLCVSILLTACDSFFNRSGHSEESQRAQRKMYLMGQMPFGCALSKQKAPGTTNNGGLLNQPIMANYLPFKPGIGQPGAVVSGMGGQLVAAFVFFVAGMTFNPMKFYLLSAVKG